MVPRFRSNRLARLKPVHSIKHVVDKQGTVTAGTPAVEVIQDTVDAPVLAQTDECETGSVVNSFYLDVEVNLTARSGLPNIYMIVMKDPGGAQPQPGANAVGAFDQKALIIHQEMVMMEQSASSNPRTLFKGVIRVPKIYRRMRPQDRILIIILGPGVTLQYCIQAIYKEYR